MRCANCGKTIPPGAVFCDDCGYAVDQQPALVGAGAGANSPVGAGGSGSLVPGTPLQGGRYVVKRVLGQGGMGTALLAQDTRVNNKAVVIKALLTEHATDPLKVQEDVQNFKREVETLAELDHPLIPNVTDQFQEGNRYYMVQEYVGGDNLEERIERMRGPMSEKVVLEFALELLDILEYLEGLTPPIVHRDIKPANIIIGTRDKRAHLVDFGIARADAAKNAKRMQTAALGTPGYAPPEQYQGNAEPRSDLYALAATMHHLLTGRDPRNEVPFDFPPVRALNAQLSPEIEEVLQRALERDITARYADAAAMRQDIVRIMQDRLGGVTDAGSNYLLHLSASLGADSSSSSTSVTSGVGRTAAAVGSSASSASWRSSPGSGQLSLFAPSGGSYRRAVSRRARANPFTFRVFLPALLLTMIMALWFYVVFPRVMLHNDASTGAQNASSPATGIGAVSAPDGETIGLSDGSVAFDVNRPDGTLKGQAADKFKANDRPAAAVLWQQALQRESNDAEPLIYLEDQRVLSGNHPYITLVVATMLTGDSTGVGRDDLQGAYLAQKVSNDGFQLPDGYQVRLLIANTGDHSQYATSVANQIVREAHADPSFAGVMGWPFSSYTLAAVKVLQAAHIPMVSQTASSDALTGISPYFFRVVPANMVQGIAGAHYVEQDLHAKTVALFEDPQDAYSKNLADDFRAQFTADGGSIVATETYTVGQAATLPQRLQDALGHAPDVLYFSGYASDVTTLLTDLPTSGPGSQVPVMGGDALYELGGYTVSARANFSRLRFTSFAYPDEWDVLGYTSKKPAFFAEYPRVFNPSGGPVPSPYGFTRTDSDVMLSYDALQLLLKGWSIALRQSAGKLHLQDLRAALLQVNGTQAIQGVSGQIAVGQDGDPVQKAIVILHVAPQGFIQMLNAVQGRFLLGS